MSEKMKHVAVSLLMGFATVVGVLIGFSLCVAIFYGLDIAVQTHPVITAVCGLVLFSVALAVVYYNKRFK